MDPQPVTPLPSPFPVPPADVPKRAVRYVQRTMARHGQPVDEELAQVLVAGMIAVLTETPGDGAVSVTTEQA